ncbi:Hypothetical protein GLP15_4286 [Giardia lamblia P15]|uniref:Uncharacterized protein n=1 Tax=Giardia intestinalis (strain P15) TaxID=658858 RepID=E1EVN4_GIAIA|nr:Hypothetical protein GLP15_4286 [Giardia lamblia P15]
MGRKGMCPLCLVILRSKGAVQRAAVQTPGAERHCAKGRGRASSPAPVVQVCSGLGTYSLAEPHSRKLRASQEIAEMSLAYTGGSGRTTYAIPLPGLQPPLRLEGKAGSPLNNAAEASTLLSKGSDQGDQGNSRPRPNPLEGYEPPPPANGKHGQPCQIIDEEAVRAVNSRGLKSPGPSGLDCVGKSSSRCKGSGAPCAGLRRDPRRSPEKGMPCFVRFLLALPQG